MAQAQRLASAAACLPGARSKRTGGPLLCCAADSTWLTCFYSSTLPPSQHMGLFACLFWVSACGAIAWLAGLRLVSVMGPTGYMAREPVAWFVLFLLVVQACVE